MGNYKYFISPSNKFLNYKFYIDIVKKGNVDLYRKQIIYSEYTFYLGKLTKQINLDNNIYIQLNQLPKEIVLTMMITSRI